MGAALTEFARQGRPCYGGSAGALVFGSTIATCAHLDNNENGLAELAGLNLCHGRALWVHAGEDDRQRISAFMAATPSEVLAVPENTAVYVQADTIASLGEGQVWRWTTTGRTPVPPLIT
jgi:dipeptidase E